MVKDTAVVEVEHLKMLVSEEVPWGRTSSSCSCAMSSLMCGYCQLEGFFHTQNFFLGKGFFLSVFFSPEHL